MITFTGMSTTLALRVADRVKDQQINSIENAALNKREMEAFREKVSNINSVDDFINDYDVFSFMMKAYDLEEKIYAKGLMKKVFESDINDPTSLINRLNDPKIRALAKAMDFSSDGLSNGNTSSLIWAEQQVHEYLNTTYIKQNGEAHEGLGAALKFREKAPEVTTWYGILGDADLANFMRTALGVPAQTAVLDVDQQVKILEKKYDIEKLQNPEEIEELIGRFAIFKDAETQQQSQSPILQLIGGGSGGYLPVTLNIDAITSFNPGSLYR